MRKDCYYVSIDLNDAYYSVAVHLSVRKYYQFFWEEILIYSITNGSAPRIFTQIMKPVFSHLRKLRHSIIAYMDDCYFQKITGNIVSEMLII